MSERHTPLAELYETDELAWLDRTTTLIRAGEYARLDYANIIDQLESEARRQRRRVECRLVRLLYRVLVHVHAPVFRNRKRRAKILHYQHELQSWTDTPTLRAHAIERMPRLYRDALTLARYYALNPRTPYPVHCPFTLDQLLAFDIDVN